MATMTLSDVKAHLSEVVRAELIDGATQGGRRARLRPCDAVHVALALARQAALIGLDREMTTHLAVACLTLRVVVP
ncbi:MAG: hypothetical protein HYV63_06985 [Candidatus Schekmanbacteria bacterium]|nr:hypothetical protein [Candidatus Schekmanbacteria bacterium]